MPLRALWDQESFRQTESKKDRFASWFSKTGCLLTIFSQERIYTLGRRTEQAKAKFYPRVGPRVRPREPPREHPLPCFQPFKDSPRNIPRRYPRKGPRVDGRGSPVLFSSVLFFHQLWIQKAPLFANRLENWPFFDLVCRNDSWS